MHVHCQNACTFGMKRGKYNDLQVSDRSQPKAVVWHGMPMQRALVLPIMDKFHFLPTHKASKRIWRRSSEKGLDGDQCGWTAHGEAL
jgi:hypothetical protein